MEIGYIITNEKINIGPEFKVVSTVDDIIFKELPILVIGYDNICELYGANNINILNRCVKKNVFWTLKKNVKRDIYNIDIENFIRYSYKERINYVKYVDLDVIQFKYKKLIYIVRKLLTITNAISYETENRVIYIYSDNIIFGIDLNLLEYVGVNPEKIKNKIKQKSVTFLTGAEILIEYKDYLERFDNDIKLLPLLYSINPHA